ncbi:hypothetical protein KW507_15725 [Vibrio fluvialis]|nr:hypothetical protein [Vibrio fluvialis]
MKKLSIQDAALALAIDDVNALTLGALKRMYKRAILSVHPDRGGKKEDAQRLNAAYSTLKSYVPMIQQSTDDESDFLESDIDNWFYKRNDGHPLHDTHLSSMYSLETLLRKTFQITEEVPDIEFMANHEYQQDEGVYFKDAGRHYCLSGHLWSGSSNFRLTDITDCGRTRGVTWRIQIAVESYSERYSQSSSLVSNVMREWFKDKPFAWSAFYNNLMQARFAAVEQCIPVPIMGQILCMNSANNGTVIVGGSKLTIYFEEVALNRTLNPFDLSPFKPLKKKPGRWKIRDLVCALLNGQFYRLKHNYTYTDDYAYDAANKYGEGYISNPVSIAKEWIKEERLSCTKLWERENTGYIVFGFHSNDSSGFIVDIDNRFPLEDIDTEVAMISQVIRRLDKPVA